MRYLTSNRKKSEVPLGMVGANKFGAFPKISLEQTWNMYITDGWLTSYPGYQSVNSLNLNAQGRELFYSTRAGRMFVVIDNGFYLVGDDFSMTLIAELGTTSGDVYIDEDEKNNIGIADGLNIYIYNYVNATFQTVNSVTLGFLPGYITYQNGRFIAAALNSPSFRLCSLTNPAEWPETEGITGLVGTIQTKPDNVVAVRRFPGRGDLLLVFGTTVTEFWYNVPLQLFPYQKSTSINIDYGCLSSSTIAYNDNMVVWLGSNEKSGPVIMYTNGGDVKQISTDGINARLERLVDPTNTYAFLFKTNGHLFYQITFADPADNFTLAYDFNTNNFYSISDENFNYHIAKRIAFVNDTYFFVSFNDGNLYQFDPAFYDLNGKTMPQVRIGPTVRGPRMSRFVIGNITFPIEQGNSGNVQYVDFSMCKDGNQNFGSASRKTLNSQGRYANRFNIWRLGAANEFTPQFRFYGLGRYLVGEGVVRIYQ